MSLPFLHTEVEKSWKKPYSGHIYFQHSNYLNVEGLHECGYVRMPPVEKTLAGYLSQRESSSLKVPVLPSKPLQTSLCLNGRAYVAAGQANGAFHTMAMLQAYQVDQLRDLDQVKGLSLEAVTKLCHTKQTAAAIGHQCWR